MGNLLEQVQLASLALGLATLCGLNLYAVTFGTGLAIKMGWVVLTPGMEGLEILTNPVLLTVMGCLWVTGFILEKIPWAGNVWDVLHTLIRPVGAVLIVSKGLDAAPNQVLELLCLVPAGVFALYLHAFKTCWRLSLNMSGQRQGALAASLGEDLLVILGIAGVFLYPAWVMLGLLVVFIFLCMETPWLIMAFRAQFAFVVAKFKSRDFETDPEKVILPTILPYKYEARLKTQKDPDEKLVWAMPCYSGKMTRIGAHVPGYIIQTSNKVALYFVGRKSSQNVYRNLNLMQCKVSFDEGPLFDEVIVRDKGVKYHYAFRFPKTHTAYAKKIFHTLLRVIPPASDMNMSKSEIREEMG